MRTFRLTVLTAICGLALVGCQTTDTQKSGYAVDLTANPDIGMGYPEMAREMSNGSVQVYSLDGPPMVLSAPDRVHPQMINEPVIDYGQSAMNDPNVTVYSLDSGPAAVHTMPPPLAPPSGVRPDMPSPFPADYAAPMPLSAPPATSGYVPITRSTGEYLAPPPSAPLYNAPVAAPVSGDEMGKVYFNHGSSQIGSAGKQVLDHVAMAGTGRNIAVEGHASERADIMDPVERKIINLKVSMDRAFKVSSELIRKGVPAGSIVTKAYGDTRPSYEPAASNKEAMDRRVEIKSEY